MIAVVTIPSHIERQASEWFVLQTEEGTVKIVLYVSCRCCVSHQITVRQFVKLSALPNWMLTKTQEREYPEKKIGQNGDVISKVHLDIQSAARYNLIRTEFPFVIRLSTFVSMNDITRLMFLKQWELDYLQQAVFGKCAKLKSWIGRHFEQNCKICSSIAHVRITSHFYVLSHILCSVTTERVFVS